jgi:hypothetical protein
MSTTNYYFTSKHLSPASTSSASERLRRLSPSTAAQEPLVEADISKPSAIPIAEAVITKYMRHLGQRKL